MDLVDEEWRQEPPLLDDDSKSHIVCSSFGLIGRRNRVTPKFDPFPQERCNRRTGR